jgi:hypothetical protein
MTSNRKEWQMSQLLSLIHEESINKLSELTKRTYTLEQQVARLEEYNRNQ